MKKSRFTDERIIRLLKQIEGGVPVKDLCRKHGFSDATFYKWRSRLGGLDVSEVRCLRELESENTKLNKLLAEARDTVATWPIEYNDDARTAPWDTGRRPTMPPSGELVSVTATSDQARSRGDL